MKVHTWDEVAAEINDHEIPDGAIGENVDPVQRVRMADAYVYANTPTAIQNPVATVHPDGTVVLKGTFGRDKVCATAIGPRAREELQKLHDSE